MNDTTQAVDEYIATLKPGQQQELRRIKSVVQQVVPEVEQGVSYAMPAYIYKGKALLSCMVNKNFLSIYPFSGKVVEALRDKLEGYELTSGSIHFNLEKPLSEALIREIIQARQQEIDVKIRN